MGLGFREHSVGFRVWGPWRGLRTLGVSWLNISAVINPPIQVIISDVNSSERM